MFLRSIVSSSEVWQTIIAVHNQLQVLSLTLMVEVKVEHMDEHWPLRA